MTDSQVEKHGAFDLNPSQAWFWTEDWQAGERKVDEYIAAGNFETFDSIVQFLYTLESKEQC